MNKLSKLIDNFKQKHLSEQTVRMLKDYEFLRAYLPKVFPDEESIEILSLIQPSAENKDIKSYTEDFLPLHSQDTEWMAKYINKSIKNDMKNGADLPKVKFDNIQSFVEVDPEFKDERDRYERDLTFVEIENLLIDRKTDDQSDYKAMQDRVNKSFHVEETFRHEILRKLTNFGLDSHNIETTLETYAEIWRSEAMDKTYINRFIRPLVLAKNHIPAHQYVEILDKISALRPEWKNLREKHYYDKHERIIDELGLATENMKMSKEESYARYNAWQDKYQDTIFPVWNIAYAKTEEDEAQRKFKASLDYTPTDVESIKQEPTVEK